MSRQENFGYTMLHRAISMAESMGIVNNARKLLLQAPHFSKDMTSSLKRTAWGLFQIDTWVQLQSALVKRDCINVLVGLFT